MGAAIDPVAVGAVGVHPIFQHFLFPDQVMKPSQVALLQK